MTNEMDTQQRQSAFFFHWGLWTRKHREIEGQRERRQLGPERKQPHKGVKRNKLAT